MWNQYLNLLTMDLVYKKYIDLLILRDKNIAFYGKCPLNFSSGNGWKLIKVGAKVLSDVVIFSMPSSYIPLDFQE